MSCRWPIVLGSSPEVGGDLLQGGSCQQSDVLMCQSMLGDVAILASKTDVGEGAWELPSKAFKGYVCQLCPITGQRLSTDLTLHQNPKGVH